MTIHFRLFLLFAGILPVRANAQTIERDVLANAGRTDTLLLNPSNIYTVSWTLGESFVATRQSVNPEVIATEGFQQSETGTTPTIELPETFGKIIVSPNPVGDVLQIAFSVLPTAPVRAVLSDLNGQTLRAIEIRDQVSLLDLGGLPTATYILSLTNDKNWARATQVVKY